MSNKKAYNEDAIQILEGLEAVRKRPAMYIGSTSKSGLHHLVYEIVDNATDEALNGYGKQIEVTITSNNGIKVRDYGRGVPTGKHATGKSTPEVIFTVLHAGGKFGQGGYKTSGGLHGVGSSVVNALSSEMSVRIWREGYEHFLEFEEGGKVKTPLKKVKKCGDVTGTEVYFKPDGQIFSSLIFSFDTLNERFREKAFLCRGLKIILRDERKEEVREEVHCYEEGLKQFAEHLIGQTPKLTPTFYFEGTDEETGIEMDIALVWKNDYTESVLSFVNNVRTVNGGTHETGAKTAITKVINDYGREINLLKDKQKKLEGKDVREGLVALVSLRIPEEILEFEGQTKEKLGTMEARAVVDNYVGTQLLHELSVNKQSATAILEKAIKAQKVREQAQKARTEARKGKNKKPVNLTGKLAKATKNNKNKNELYLVEGDSAGGSAKQGRDNSFQAILPLRGKVKNVWDAKVSEVMSNEEIQTIIHAIGAGYGDDFKVEDSNYDKIVIMTDADNDGSHIQVLLLTFFYKYMKPLIEEGKLYIALPPLYKLSVFGRTGKVTKVEYFWDNYSMQSYLKENKIPEGKYDLQRYKGLGEMNYEQLWETTMNPETRLFIQVKDTDSLENYRKLETLMSDNVEPRRRWIEEEVNFEEGM